MVGRRGARWRPALHHSRVHYVVKGLITAGICAAYLLPPWHAVLVGLGANMIWIWVDVE